MLDKYMQDPEWWRLYVGEGVANEIAETIARIMQEGNLSLADIAKSSGMYPRTLRGIMRGDGMTVQRVASVLDALGYRLVVKVEKKIDGEEHACP